MKCAGEQEEGVKGPRPDFVREQYAQYSEWCRQLNSLTWQTSSVLTALVVLFISLGGGELKALAADPVVAAAALLALAACLFVSCMLVFRSRSLRLHWTINVLDRMEDAYGWVPCTGEGSKKTRFRRYGPARPGRVSLPASLVLAWLLLVFTVLAAAGSLSLFARARCEWGVIALAVMVSLFAWLSVRSRGQLEKEDKDAAAKEAGEGT